MNRPLAPASCVVVLAAMLAGGLPAAAQAPDAEPVRQAIGRATAFLQTEGTAWIEQRKCASCHHVPMMVWTLNEVQRAGYPIDSQVLASATQFCVEADNRAKVLPSAENPDANNAAASEAALAVLYLKLALAASPAESPPTPDGVQRLVDHMIAKQAADGSWNVKAGRLPIIANQEESTLLGYLALAGSSTPAADNPATAPVLKAGTWIEQAPPGQSNQAHVLRILFGLRAGRSPEELRPAIEALLARQRADGGFSQEPDSADRTYESDAFATGQALYVLGEPALGVDRAAIDRAVAFLLSTQAADGSWPMQSRPHGPEGKRANNLKPIVYAAASWATLGLVKAHPQGNTQ